MNRWNVPALCLLLGLAPLNAQVSSSPDLPEDPSRIPYEDHMIVHLLPGHSIDPIAAATGSEVVFAHERRGHYLLKTPAGLTEGQIESMVFAVKGVPTVLLVEADEDLDPPESVGCGPEEELVGAQQCTIAFLDAIPSMGTFNSQPALDQIHGPEAHALATGIPMLVAVIDTGVDVSHPIFTGHLAAGGYDYITGAPGGADFGDGVDNDGDGAIDEGLGHGTHVAGLVLLSDPNAMILPMRALDSDGNGSAFIISQAIFDAVDAGATVINLSLSSRQVCNALAESLMYAEYHGVSVVTSAGNAASDSLFPGNYKIEDFAFITPTWLPTGVTLDGSNVIAISSVDDFNIKPGFACWGDTIDLVAPGVDVYSAQMGGAMAWWSGTSMSSGVASGATSFLLSIWDQGSYGGSALDLLKATAVDVDPLNPEWAGELGAGIIHLELGAETLLGL